jgi:UDP-glucose 4-epimerase
MPAPAMSALGDVGKRLAGMSGFSPELLRWLTYGRVIDSSRLVAELSWRPKYSSEAAFTDFLHSHGLGHNLALDLLDRLSAPLTGLPGGHR